MVTSSISNSVPGTLFRAEMTRKDIFLSLTGIWVINNIREHIVNHWISLSEKTNVYGWTLSSALENSAKSCQRVMVEAQFATPSNWVINNIREPYRESFGIFIRKDSFYG
jgi:hypothetical protein